PSVQPFHLSGGAPPVRQRGTIGKPHRKVNASGRRPLRRASREGPLKADNKTGRIKPLSIRHLRHSGRIRLILLLSSETGGSPTQPDESRNPRPKPPHCPGIRQLLAQEPDLD